MKILEEPLCVASRGRNPENPSDRSAGAELQQRLEVNKNGTTNALTSVQKDNMVLEPITTSGNEIAGTLRASMHKQGERNLVENLKNGRGYEGVVEPILVGGIGEPKSNNGTQWYQQNRIYDAQSVAMCHPASIPSGSYNYKVQGCRVRKLTEKECFRLQGVRDEDFERVRKNQSKSSCYHLAGDSITTSVLMALFGELLDVDWRKEVDRLAEELCNG